MPSPAATSSAAGSRPSVAVIVPFITRWFFATVTSGAVNVLRDRGYDAVLYHLGSADIRDQFFERIPLDPRVQGILTLSMPLTEEHTLALRALDLPMVSVEQRSPAHRPSGSTREVPHARRSTTWRTCGTNESASSPVSPTIPASSSSPPMLAAAGTSRRCGRPASPSTIDWWHRAPTVQEGGAAAMAQLLARPILPTAVFAEYDELAIGALWALRRSGLDVPGDVSVVGVDDHQMSQMLDLTTVAQSVAAQGEIAAELLVQVLQDEADGGATRPVVLPTRLVLRGTTSPPATARSTPRLRRISKGRQGSQR